MQAIQCVAFPIQIELVSVEEFSMEIESFDYSQMNKPTCSNSHISLDLSL